MFERPLKRQKLLVGLSSVVKLLTYSGFLDFKDLVRLVTDQTTLKILRGTRVDISYKPITQDQFYTLFKSGTWCPIGVKFRGDISWLVSGLGSLRVLDLIGEFDITTLSECSNLEKLNLRDCEVSDVSTLVQCRKLHTLDLSYCPLTDVSALGRCDKLQTLNLSHSQLTDMSTLEQCNKLHFLNLSNSRVSLIGQYNLTTINFNTPQTTQ